MYKKKGRRRFKFNEWILLNVKRDTDVNDV